MRLAKLLVVVLAAFLFVSNANATSANTDLTDLWWNPSESGWGMQMVNTGTYVYATIYVYGPDGKPTWYGGGLNNTGTPVVTYTGTLYAATGPYFGGAFNPASVHVRPVGSITFTGTTTSAGIVTYSVDGVIVTKNVQRQPLTLDNYNGTYASNLTATISGCLNPANNGNSTTPVGVTISQNGNSMSQIWIYPNGSSCTFIGTYSQLGRMGQFNANYSCVNGEVGTSSLYEMNTAINIFAASVKVVSSNILCAYNGEIAGVIGH